MGQAARHKNIGRSIMFGPYVYALFNVVNTFSNVLRLVYTLTSYKAIGAIFNPFTASNAYYNNDSYVISISGTTISIKINNDATFWSIERPALKHSPLTNTFFFSLSATPDHLAFLLQHVIHGSFDTVNTLYLIDWQTQSHIAIDIATPHWDDGIRYNAAAFSLSSSNRLILSGYRNSDNASWHRAYSIDIGNETSSFLWERIDAGTSVRPGSQMLADFAILQFPRAAHADDDGGRIAVCNPTTGAIINAYDIDTDIVPPGGFMFNAAQVKNDLFIATGGATVDERVHSIIRYKIDGNALNYEYALQSFSPLDQSDYLFRGVYSDAAKG